MPVVALLLCWLAPPPADGAESIGRLAHPPIREASGIVASRKYPGVFWVHNDSGNPPVLYAVKRDGTLVGEFKVGVANLDWEDIATDDAGHLYIGEIGNNDGRLPIRCIYRLDEPDPAIPRTEPLPITLATYYRFSSQAGRFDAESLFVVGNSARIVSKRLDGREAEIFSIPLDPPATLLHPALPKRLAKLRGFTEPATGADLSPDGERLAVCSTTVVRVYRKSKDEDWRLIGSAPFAASGVEAVAWDGRDLILASEGRELIRIREASWRTKAPGKSKR